MHEVVTVGMIVWTTITIVGVIAGLGAVCCVIWVIASEFNH